MATKTSSISIDASRQKVWDALTKAELVKLWQYGSDLVTTWQEGTEIRFITAWEGKIFEQWGKVLQVIPNESISYSLFFPRPDLEDKPENYFIMKYVLTGDGDKTLVKIIQEDNRPDAAQEETEEEENAVLQALRKVAEGL